MALRIAITRLQMKTIGSRPSALNINYSLSRMKHFNSESPLAKHTKRQPSIISVIGTGVAIGVVIGVTYAYFSKKERKLPGVIINVPISVPILQVLPSNLKITRKV